MKKFKAKKSIITGVLIVCMTVISAAGIASAKTVKDFNDCTKFEYGTTFWGNPYARSYTTGTFDSHWASVEVQETGSYARKNTPYKGWTSKATADPGTWWTYHYTVTCGRGL